MKIKILTIIMISFLTLLNGLNLDDALKIALENNPELLAAEQSKKASKTNLWNTYLSILPSATVNRSDTYFDETQTVMNSLLKYDASTNYNLIVNQPIFNGGKVWLGASISRSAYKISKSSYQNAYLQTVVDLKSKYFAVLANEELMKIAEKSLKNSNTNLQIAQVKYDTGNLAKADLLQLQSEQANKEIELLQMKMLYENSRLDLANFLQLDKIEDLQPVEKEKYEPEILKLREQNMQDIEELEQEILNIGMNKSPSLNMARLGVNTNRKSLWMAGGNFLPTLNFQYIKTWNKYDFEDEFNENSGQLGLNFSLPIFPLVNNGLEVATSRHQLKQSIYELQSTENSMELAIKSAVLNLVSQSKKVHAAEISLEYSRQMYQQMNHRFAGGQISANDLLSTEIMYSAAQNQAAQSFYDYLSAKASLVQLMGVNDEKVLNNIIENKELK
ncbi:MAG: TolC family protein [Candidatus Cloacimonadota bacterium]|nr:TolC family protein [Candidatus Cloacimonadota bacterium]